MHHVQRIKLEVVALIKPGADKVIEPESVFENSPSRLVTYIVHPCHGPTRVLP